MNFVSWRYTKVCGSYGRVCEGRDFEKYHPEIKHFYLLEDLEVLYKPIYGFVAHGEANLLEMVLGLYYAQWQRLYLEILL